MSTVRIRQKLHNYLEIMDDKKVKALYFLFKDNIENITIEYTQEFKEELERRYDFYKNGGKMISPEESNARIMKILQKG